jgi:hypothetical protein
MTDISKPQADKIEERVVKKYQGAQIIDAREKIKVTFEQRPAGAAAYMLQLYGFKPLNKDRLAFEAKNNVRNIFHAQDILNTWQGDEIQ